LICQVEDTAADLDSYSTVTFSGGVDGCKRCRAYKQDVKSLTASLTTKTRVIKDLQDKCHALNTAATLGAPGVRGGARGGGGGHRGGRGGGGAFAGRNRASKRARAASP